MFYSKANNDKAVNLHFNDQRAKVQIDHLEYNESHSLFFDEKAHRTSWYKLTLFIAFILLLYEN